MENNVNEKRVNEELIQHNVTKNDIVELIQHNVPEELHRQHNDIVKSFSKFEKKSYQKYKELYDNITADRKFISGSQTDELDKTLLGTEASDARINITANAIRTIVNSYTPYQYKWHFSDAQINAKGIEFLDDVDNTTGPIEALTNAVGTGLGVLVFSTDYAVDGSVKPILYSMTDVTNVRLDPNSVKLNGSDATEAALIELKNRSKVKDEYGLEVLSDKPLVDISNDYDRKEYIPVITYYKKEADGVHCYKLVNDSVVDDIVLNYSYIPVIPVYGESSWTTENEQTFNGIVKQIRPIQKLVNYTYRQLLIRCSKSPKNTWTAEAESIEGYEQYYKNADKSLNPLLIYNGYSSDGTRQLTPPTRLSNEVAVTDMSTLMQNALGLTNSIIGIPATGLETDIAKTATEVLSNEKTFNNNVRSYLQHLKYALQLIGVLFAEEITGTTMVGSIKVDVIEGPDAAMEKQEARFQLNSYAALITDEADKKSLMKAMCMIEDNNQYVRNFAELMTPSLGPVDEQAQQLIAQADQEIKNRDNQILQLQKKLEETQNQLKLNAYSLERELMLSRQKFEQEKALKLLDAELNGTANALDNAKTEAEIANEQADLNKKAIDLRNAELNEYMKRGLI